MLLALCVTLLLALTTAQTGNALWPKPQSFVNGTTPLRLAPTFDIWYSPATGRSPQEPPQDLARAMKRALGQITKDKHRRLNVERGEDDRSGVEQSVALDRLEVVLIASKVTPASISEEINKPYSELNEAYELSLPHDSTSGGKIAILSANSTLGLARGLQIFTQLVYWLPGSQNEGGGEGILYIPNSPLHVLDEPAFAHRGFMLDTSRHFYPVADILRTLETMASVKLNVFHWHATDSQSWPLAVPAFPDLVTDSPDREGSYSAKDIDEIVEYAGGLGISVMLEIDMPGHTASIAQSYPDYVACRDFRPWSKFSVEPPAGQLKLGDPETLEFAQRMLASSSSQFPSKYFSTGGDEINDACYQTDPSTSALLSANNATLNDLLFKFVNGTHGTLRSVGKTPVVWEELVLGRNLPLKNDTIVLNWISSEHVKEVVERGYRIIHAASNYFYLDCGLGGWLGKNSAGNSWCDPYKTWSKIYSFDPFQGLGASQYDQVLGGEALAWSEQIDPTNLDSLVWPRAAAAAEVFWSGGSLQNGSRDLGEALSRIHDWRYRAVNRGIRAAPLQPHWCALRPGSCDLE
ncbi:beta-N-acetylhexosaminidase [Sporobolomyces salmoneus]|uniref:beta-N-acetylhexosaminidase n=1 Tax=Sporobolomyces salmoneus TaxID=183962 RepID=UPI00316EFB86